MALMFGLSIASYGLAVLYETFYLLPFLLLKVLYTCSIAAPVCSQEFLR